MKVRPLRDPLPGEQMVGVDPPLAPETDAAWRRRLNLVPGRALDADALAAEQDGRAGRLATRGQMLSSGVVAGLEVLLEGDPEQGFFLRIGAGMGLMPSGEDVGVVTDLRLALGDIQVYGPLAPEEPVPEDEEDDESAPAPTLRTRQVLGSFAEWAQTDDATLPRAAILVLEPVEVELLQVPQSADDPGADPCEEDPSAFPFENWERRDACRPLLYVWPTEWQPLPPRIRDGEPDPSWRNQLAYTVFRQEGRKGPEDALPWEEVGVPIALIGFAEDWTPLFVDRNSVARAGGKPPRRTDPLPGTGNPFLWQARFDQLLEELADADSQNAPIADLVARFRYLPPSGLLPRSACAPEMAHQWFFPSSYVIDAAPVPIEHLDVALEASASLSRYDLFTPDQVRLLVPVPRRFWEPRLLHGEDVDPRFEQAIAEAVARRSDWLDRRDSLRRKAAVLLHALTGLAPAYPSPEEDPGRLDPEEEAAKYPCPVSGLAHQSGVGPGPHTHGFTGATGTLTLETGDRFVVWVFADPANPPRTLGLTWLGVKDGIDRQERAYWGAKPADGTAGLPPALDLGAPPPAGRWVRLEVDAQRAGLIGVALSGMEFTTVDGRAAWARAGRSPITDPSPASESVWIHDGLPAGATVIPADAAHEEWMWLAPEPATADREADFGTAREGTPPIRVVTALERLVDELIGRLIGWDELRLVYSHGLERFVETLEAAIDQANDQINFGYLRVQTAMYRLRQAVLGDKVADRLVTSPVLAAIARESQATTQVTKSLTEVFQSLKQTEQAQKPKRWWGRELEVTSLITGGGGVDDLPVFGAKSVLRATSPTPAKSIAEVAIVAKPATASLSPFDLVSGNLGGTVVESAAVFGGKAAEIASIIKGGAAASPAGPKAEPAGVDVEAARPAAEKAIRTTSIAERIEDSRAVEAKDFCAATKRDVIKGLLTLAMEVDDLPVPGMPLTEKSPEFEAIQQSGDVGPADLPDEGPVPRYREVVGPLGRELLLGTGMPAREAKPRPLGAFRDAEGVELLNWIPGEADPLIPSDNEAGYFAVGSDLLNHATALLRSAEGRVAEYRGVIERTQQAIEQITAAALDSDRRLKVIEDELAEARADVATGRALLADERQRVLAINQRREAILREHVTFVAYHRPRLTDPLVDAPVRPLDPGPTASPVPECLEHDEPVPGEVREYLDLLHDVPAGWFVELPRLFDRFDRPPLLHGVLAHAKARSGVAARVPEPAKGPATIVGRALSGVRTAHAEVAATFRRQREAVDLAPLVAESWTTLRAVAPAIVGLADLMDPAHGRSDVAQLATQEVDRIARVAGCLYRHFSDVPPVVRLDWAERFSQYDTPINLRDLAALPSWGTLDVLDRREMQALVDWLFLRVRADQAEAVSLINDLIRTCLLVASHSPVNQILSGHVEHDTPVQPGGRVRLVAPAAVRVGMHALLYRGETVVARAVVEDLTAGVAAARIVQADRTEMLSQGARVQFSDAPPPAALNKAVAADMMTRRGK